MENFNELDQKIKQMAERIRELREIVGYTHEEMAQKTGVSEEEYALCEKGEKDLKTCSCYMPWRSACQRCTWRHAVSRYSKRGTNKNLT